MPWSCHICKETSEDICPICTKDVCANHICETCGRCTDCCKCEADSAHKSGE